MNTPDTPQWRPKRYRRDLQEFKLIADGSGTWVKYADALAYIVELESQLKAAREDANPGYKAMPLNPCDKILDAMDKAYAYGGTASDMYHAAMAAALQGGG